MKMAASNRIVIIGGLAAGMAAASQARRIDPNIKITIVEAGERISYGICGLPYLISGEIESEKALLYYTPDQLLKERNIKVLTKHRVVDIRHSQRIVIAETEKDLINIPYEKLILCTGAKAKVPFDLLDASSSVFTLRTLDDAKAIISFIEQKHPKKACVVGSGVLGLEIVDVLKSKNLEITLVEQAERPAPHFDGCISTAVRTHLIIHGVEVKCGENPESVSKDQYGKTNALISNGRSIPCDMIVVAAGVVPSTGLSNKCGIHTHSSGAIHVNDLMETSVPGIYACGDCASATHSVGNHDYYLPTATVAVKGGRVAGSNAAGKYATFNGTLGTQGIKLLGWELACTGLTSAQAAQYKVNATSTYITAQANAQYMGEKPSMLVKLIADSNNKSLIGAQLFGPEGAILRCGILTTAISTHMKIDRLAELDLPYTPHISPAWDPILIAARQLLKKLNK